MIDAYLEVAAVAFDVGLFVLGAAVLSRGRRHISRKRQIMALLGTCILLFGGIDLVLLTAMRVVSGK